MGYEVPSRHPEPLTPEATAVPHLMDFDPDNNIVVGFVSRNQLHELSSRARSSLDLHIVSLNARGVLRREYRIATEDWYDNWIAVGSSGNLFIRTNDLLTLLAPTGAVLSQRRLPAYKGSYRRWWRFLPFPDRTSIVLFDDDHIEILSLKDLRTVSTCNTGPFRSILSVSNHNILFRLHDDAGDPSTATLLDDTHIVLAGSGYLIRVQRVGGESWQASFEKGADEVARTVEETPSGDAFAIAVRHMKAGNRLFDLARTLKALRVVVFQSNSSHPIQNISVDPLPKYNFDFGLSKDGKCLATLADNVLRLTSVTK